MNFFQSMVATQNGLIIPLIANRLPFPRLLLPRLSRLRIHNRQFLPPGRLLRVAVATCHTGWSHNHWLSLLVTGCPQGLPLPRFCNRQFLVDVMFVDVRYYYDGWYYGGIQPGCGKTRWTCGTQVAASVLPRVRRKQRNRHKQGSNRSNAAANHTVCCQHKSKKLISIWTWHNTESKEQKQHELQEHKQSTEKKREQPLTDPLSCHLPIPNFTRDGHWVKIITHYLVITR